MYGKILSVFYFFKKIIEKNCLTFADPIEKAK